MATRSQQKYQLGMAGEYGVCSEILKRGMDASITMGNAKAVDILVFCPNGTLRRVEVKTTRSGRFVTNFFQKYYNKNAPHPDYWVLVYIDKQDVSHYYVLTHDEMGDVQKARNNMTTWSQVVGCDNVLLKDVQTYKGKWNKIL